MDSEPGIQKIVPAWVRWSELGFAFSFTAFSFVMFSCWFPTGFSAVFSTLAFVFALMIFSYQSNSVELLPFEIVGLLLFGWLGLSIFWSETTIIESLGYLSEYRFYFMMPIFIYVLSIHQKVRHWAFFAALTGAFVALVTSYGLGFGWWQIEGAGLSLGNRIFHGFIMASFLLASLLLARERTGWVRISAILVACAVTYNVLNVETGRTGYLQVIIVLLIFIVLSFSRLWVMLCMLAVVFMITASLIFVEKFQSRVFATFTNVESMITEGDYHSSAGTRLEFYRGAILIGLENPIAGVGVGDAVNVLRAEASNGNLKVPTDNVHSEFMNMFIVGGFPALLMFGIFVGSLAYSGSVLSVKSRFIGHALIGVAGILLVSAVFNSTIKDYGEKHVLMIVLGILGSHKTWLSDKKASREVLLEKVGQS